MVWTASKEPKEKPLWTLIPRKIFRERMAFGDAQGRKEPQETLDRKGNGVTPVRLRWTCRGTKASLDGPAIKVG